MRRVLLTGGSGFLGMRLCQRATALDLHPTYFTHSISHPNAHYLDARDEAQVAALVQAVQPHAIIHAAGSNRTATQIEAIVPAARALANVARDTHTRLVHLSSDVVFDGEHAPYADDAPLAPVHDYGHAKAEAERLITALCPSAVIVRPSLMWSLDPLDHQTRWLVEAVRRRERVVLFTDEFRCPVHVEDVCAAVLELTERPEITGPMNLGGPEALTRWDWGHRLLAALHIPAADAIQPGLVAHSGLTRPRNLTLLSHRAVILHTPLRAPLEQ